MRLGIDGAVQINLQLLSACLGILREPGGTYDHTAHCRHIFEQSGAFFDILDIDRMLIVLAVQNNAQVVLANLVFDQNVDLPPRT